MNEDNKYFTPEIEDFRVGYEYEYKTHDGINYLKEDFDKKEWQKGMYGFNDFPYVERTMKGRMKFQTVRVPYLTKEQIEIEGWLDTANGLIQDNYIIILDEYLHRISIIHNPTHLCRYQGECKDINTFRWLIKLLKI